MEYSCFLEDESGNEGCVFDEDYDGNVTDCDIATSISCKENCYYWRPSKSKDDLKEIELRLIALHKSKQDIISESNRREIGPLEMRVLRKYGKI